MTDESLKCIGCGASIQTVDKNQRGYTPKSAYEAGLETGELYCQRCFKLRHYNELQGVTMSHDDFLAILNGISDEDALVVNVVDIFDISGSLIPGLKRFVGDNDLLLVANKLDLLPSSIKESRLTHWVKKYARSQGLVVEELLLTSAQTQHHVDDLLEEIERLRKGRNVYVVGASNVGKSTLINSILKATGIAGDLITTSVFPGTTLDLVEIPFDESSYLIDTPGIMEDGQLTSQLSAEGLKQVMPKKRVKARTYQVNPEQSFFIGGLVQVDYLAGDRNSFTFYLSNALKIHRRKLEGAEAFYVDHVGELLTPTIEGAGDRVRREFQVKAGQDLVISGLGWLTVAEDAKLAIYSPKGIDVLVREALI
ncbi:ribosome biogenesis GTPase YqeH [Aerococcus sanguinicola]|uniref:ribosome biogenesis GTPase YqeH n=1 Tax=unclassified Aerococcus TaxID=2618060 RepID=UPI0008A41571|nr:MULTISPECIES: ribosome biogenesis GTPase YqeH [unclassified Aerococcus]KAB0647735.1 ribosome biogenesis GTPase YqeH [Aerococcus sanguinicola]MDK6233025.1 ribosome biogenesis GTPase YqeH [Aerococcus sp. UMB10185]MDK6855319.1 ribosome biogenesis GTPase YqeH [Aerococcus sp. UMB7533]OFN04897.1 ribosome biogenesis GTPase YqeH [Aerococcus sp. HMSC062A02]OHO43838.1 ribosome biogenesis GTPase YqeH [Aerococcus sp. HMSC035B07]